MPRCAARCLMLASASSFDLATAHPYPPHRGRGSHLTARFMAAVAERLVRGLLAGAEPHLLAGFAPSIPAAECGALVRAVAERLRLRPAAGAPPIALAGFDVDRRSAAGRRLHPFRSCQFLRSAHAVLRSITSPLAPAVLRSAHALVPPPAVASQASPQALASSRTRRM